MLYLENANAKFNPITTLNIDIFNSVNISYILKNIDAQKE